MEDVTGRYARVVYESGGYGPEQRLQVLGEITETYEGIYSAFTFRTERGEVVRAFFSYVDAREDADATRGTLMYRRVGDTLVTFAADMGDAVRWWWAVIPAESPIPDIRGLQIREMVVCLADETTPKWIDTDGRRVPLEKVLAIRGKLFDDGSGLIGAHLEER